MQNVWFRESLYQICIVLSPGWELTGVSPTWILTAIKHSRDCNPRLLHPKCKKKAMKVEQCKQGDFCEFIFYNLLFVNPLYNKVPF